MNEQNKEVQADGRSDRILFIFFLTLGIFISLSHVVSGLLVLKDHPRIAFTYWGKTGAVWIAIAMVGGEKFRINVRQWTTALFALGLGMIQAPFWLRPYWFVSSLGVLVVFGTLVMIGCRLRKTRGMVRAGSDDSAAK